MPFTTTSAGGNGSGIPGPQGEPGEAGAGFGIYYLGNYNPNSGYLPNIAVVRGSDGQLYLAKASGALNDPVGNTAQWEVWIPKGQDGAPGTTPFTILGEYNNGADYTYGDAVYYSGGTYVRTGNPNNPGYPPTPGSINESWTPIADKGDQANLGYITVTTENDPVEGYYTTLEAPGNIVVQSSTSPGLITIQSYEGLQVNASPENGGIYINSRNPEDKVVTAGDLQTAIGTGGNGEVTRYFSQFYAAGLTFTGTGATYPTYNSYYVKNGRMVSFNIEVNLSTVTNFGTGQYKVALPFTPQFGYNHFSGWVWADPSVSPDVGTGHTIINADTAGVTDVLDLHYLKSAGGANSPIREALFTQGAPVTLTTESRFYINGTYITAE